MTPMNRREALKTGGVALGGALLLSSGILAGCERPKDSRPPATGMLSSLLGRKSAGASSLGHLDGFAGLPDELISALETRAIWAKFGF